MTSTTTRVKGKVGVLMRPTQVESGSVRSETSFTRTDRRPAVEPGPGLVEEVWYDGMVQEGWFKALDQEG